MWRCSRLAVAAVALAATGCVETALYDARYPEPPAPLVPEPPPPTAGAIWPGETPSGSFLFFDQKARGIGDLVTVRVVENVSAEGLASTDLDRSSSQSTSLLSDLGFQELVSRPVRWLLDLVLDSPGVDVTPGTATNVLEASSDDTFEGEGTTRREGRFQAVLTCRVLEVLPGQIFRIRGRRAVVINHEMQYLTVEGLVRQQDIGIDNIVLSDSLADAKITLDGLGVIDDRQRPGWMTRVLAWVYPF